MKNELLRSLRHFSTQISGIEQDVTQIILSGEDTGESSVVAMGQYEPFVSNILIVSDATMQCNQGLKQLIHSCNSVLVQRQELEMSMISLQRAHERDLHNAKANHNEDIRLLKDSAQMRFSALGAKSN